jgi:enoyl-CoA hydratase/3-hydroxyacyl-CoA dehydrogenase
VAFEPKKVAVVGAGEMGHGIAELFAAHGYDVCLTDKYPNALAKAKDRISASLERSAEKGRLTPAQVEDAKSRISFVEDLRTAVSGAGLVIEAVPENQQLKETILKEIAESAGEDTIIASNTSNIRISDIARSVPRPERIAGMHFFNPPMVMKLVELVPGEKTDSAVLEKLALVCNEIGRTPVRVLKDSPGFIVNRINAAEMLFFCLVLDRGVATPEEVDKFARAQGLPRGPYELLDFVGLDVAWDSLSYFAKAISPEYRKGRVLGQMVESGRLGRKTGRGFYDWSSGKAELGGASATEKVSIMDIFAIEINEATKLIEEGVARPEDIEKGVVLGMGRPFGPITVAKDLSNAEVRSKLEELASVYDCKVFSPSRSILAGRLREAVEGRLGGEGGVKPGASEDSRGGAPTARPPEHGPVLIERLGSGVSRMVLNRPKFNTINKDVLEEIDRALSELWDDTQTRIVIVTGSGSVFSAGADLSQYFDSQLAFMKFMKEGERVFKRLTQFPHLTIAVLKGYALGGGLELAMSCDLRLATEDVDLGLPEVRRGLVPGLSGTQRMTRLIGLARASEIVLTGERLNGRRALEIGLVNKLIPAGDPDEYAIRYAKELSSALAPVAVALAKGLLNQGTEAPTDVGLEMEALSSGILFGTKDLREGISAFLGKRKPEFEGR